MTAGLLAQPQPWAKGDRALPGAGGPGPRAACQMVFSRRRKRKDRTTLHQIFSSFTQRMYRIFSVVLNRMCPFRVSLPLPQLSPTGQGVLL